MSFYLNGNRLVEGVPFTDAEGNSYPQNWLNLSSEEEKQAIGITWEDDFEIFDTRFYWDAGLPKALDDKEEEDEDGNKSITKGLKSNFIAQIKDTTNKLLSQSDWYVIRKIERNIDIPKDIADKRNAIITESNRLETAINGVEDVEALIEVLNTQNFQ